MFTVFKTISHTFYGFQFSTLGFSKKLSKYSVKCLIKISKLRKKVQNFEKNKKTNIFVPDGRKYLYFEKNNLLHWYC